MDNPILNQEAWLRIIDFLLKDNFRKDVDYYGKTSTISTSNDKSSDPTFRQNDKTFVEWSTYVERPYGQFHFVYILRLVSQSIKQAVDRHNRMYRRFMKKGYYTPSPWSYWNFKNQNNFFNEKNPFRRLDRNLEKEEKNKSWNNRKNKHKIRIMWKEYKQDWKPWFSEKKLYDPCKEERQAYNVFRYNLTEDEFMKRWNTIDAVLNKNELFLIAEKLSLPDLLNFCLSCKNIYNSIWNRDEFWVYKNPNLAYKNFKISNKNLFIMHHLMKKMSETCQRMKEIFQRY